MPIVRIAISDQSFIAQLCAPLMPVAVAFFENAKRVEAAAMMTPMLVGLSNLRTELSGLKARAKLIEGITARNKVLADAAAHSDAAHKERVDQIEASISKIDGGTEEAYATTDTLDFGDGRIKLLEDNYDRIRHGIDHANKSAVIGIWTVIESMISDLWISALNAKPKIELNGTGPLILRVLSHSVKRRFGDFGRIVSKLL